MMAWQKSISLEMANKIFEPLKISFEANQSEGGYLAKYEQSVLIRRSTLVACCTDILKNHAIIKE